MRKENIISISKITIRLTFIIYGGLSILKYLNVINNKETAIFITAIVLLIVGLFSMMSGETNAISVRLIGQFKSTNEVKAKKERDITADVISVSLVITAIILYIISKFIYF